MSGMRVCGGGGGRGKGGEGGEGANACMWA